MSKIALFSQDAQLIEVVLSAAAAAEVEVQVVRQLTELKVSWQQVDVALVGLDFAAGLAGLGLAPRKSVYLCGEQADQLLSWSVPLQAAVIELPNQLGYLASVLAEPVVGNESRAKTIVVSAVSGGLGASTLAAGIAWLGSRKNSQTTLVELDWLAGGIDLLFGCENQPGWRWQELSAARGNLAQLHGQLPSYDGLDIVAASRPTADKHLEIPSQQAINAVFTALSTSNQLLVLDLADNAELPACGQPCHFVLVGNNLRSTMAAKAKMAHQAWPDYRLIVRKTPGGGLSAAEVGQALEQPVFAVLPTDKRLAKAGELGQPPGYRRGAFRKLACRCLQEVGLDG